VPLAAEARVLSMAAAGSQVYWTSQKETGNEGVITSHGGAVAGGVLSRIGTISSGGGWFSRVALDAKFVYWMEDRTLYRATR
jgi:hypothetical protein